MVPVTEFVGHTGTRWIVDVEASLGEPGAHGIVYAGFGEGGESVAVKRVIGGRTDADHARRAREVEIADVLTAPRVVPTQPNHLLVPLDRGMLGDDLLIVMPRAERSLAAALRDNVLDEGQRIQALQHIVLGLVELAEYGVLHRDLKPGNVLYVNERWQLADLGMSRVLGDATATHTFLGAGTFPYMAPELWQAQPATVKSDLYAFGVLAYEVLSGVRPFVGPSQEDYRAQHRHDVPPLSPRHILPWTALFSGCWRRPHPTDHRMHVR